MGTPEYNIIGPYHNPYVFSVSRTEKGDYLLEANLYYDQVTTNMGWQRFYVQGYGGSAGTLHYCGSLSHFSNVVENSGELRLNGFLAQSPYPTRNGSVSAVTFCLDSNNPDVMGATNPFRADCTGCGCANFTLFSDNSGSDQPESNSSRLSLRVSMSGGSKHLHVDLQRVAPSPAVSDGDLALHGENFTCEFHDEGRDAKPVERRGGHAQAQKSGAGGCPFQMGISGGAEGEASPHTKKPVGPTETPNEKKGTVGVASTNSNPKAELLETTSKGDDLEHCYYLSKAAGFTLSWTLDEPNQALAVAVSAPATFGNSTWVALGFRPLSRSLKPGLLEMGTGHHMNFGMAGADIVAGSVDKGVRTLYAEDFTGAPVNASYLQLSNSSVRRSGGKEGEEERVTLSFTRPLVGGYLMSEWGVEASLLSKTALEFEGDILWAMGEDGSDDGEEAEAAGSGCAYHENTRGLRVVDWVNPAYAFPEQWARWACDYPGTNLASESELEAEAGSGKGVKTIAPPRTPLNGPALGPTLVSGEFKVESPAGEPIANMLLSILSDQQELANQSVLTNGSGVAYLTFPPDRAFVVKGTHPPLYQDLYIYGTSGRTDFQYTTFMGTRKEAQALAALNAEVPAYDPDTGYVIVGMDSLADPEQGLDPANLVPAVGASSAVLGLATPSGGFVFAPRVTFSSTITEASTSFVTYPNVQVGVQGQAVAYRPDNATESRRGKGTDNSCVISPGFNRQVPPQVIQAFPDSVTVVRFIC